ncbi:hypothetical protein RvY_07026 [Ramazzottius varieornatus]|uniref:Uncharacterized protein n=1 Tax=Ramazzottius varieornatus TaxID=947166 RepID=A0A1D1V993_RAMVA|nr:hypothetical protein RvY_07026 [Ramazzottius varieornatus]
MTDDSRIHTYIETSNLQPRDKGHSNINICSGKHVCHTRNRYECHIAKSRLHSDSPQACQIDLRSSLTIFVRTLTHENLLARA